MKISVTCSSFKKSCCCLLGIEHQDSQHSFLAFLNTPTDALDQFEVSIKPFRYPLWSI